MLAGEHKRYTWWFAIVAGMDEAWSADTGLDAISDDLLQAMLVFDLTDPIPTRTEDQTGWLVHPWKEAALRQRPDLVRRAYSAVARMKLNARDPYIAGLHEFLRLSFSEPTLQSNSCAISPTRPSIGFGTCWMPP